MPRPQFTRDQRNHLAFEYHRLRGTRDFKPEILRTFQLKFPGVRAPNKNQMKRIWEKQMRTGTVNNNNSKSSPGLTHSGRPRTVRTPANKAAVKAVMDRDATKEMGDNTRSPVSSARRNVLAIDKSSWTRIKTELR